MPGELSVEVVDDGAGGAAPLPVGVGGGLAGMEQRVQAYRGDVTSGPREIGGWRVTARLRLDTDADTDADTDTDLDVAVASDEDPA
jgi:signal transduction histidine kinase